jgi:hypothetical protein
MESETGNAGTNGTVTGFLIVTMDLVAGYESAITEHCKCTMEGFSKEFVSIQLNHNITDKTFELTQEDYWVKAVERFKEHLKGNKPKTRLLNSVITC